MPARRDVARAALARIVCRGRIVGVAGGTIREARVIEVGGQPRAR